MKAPDKDLSDLCIDDIINKKSFSEIFTLPERSQKFTFSEDAIESILQKRKKAIYYVYSTKIDEKPKNSVDVQKVRDFYDYVKKWKEETVGLSSPSTIRMNRNYQKIIGLGDSIIPLILSELEKNPDDWFYALEMLVKDEENPINDDMGFNESIKTWITWGKNKGLI